MRCPRCDLALTYHAKGETLSCHQCNYRKAIPEKCPVCWSRRIRYLGLGTERVEDEVQRAFPLARTLRWDRDVTKVKGSHERILDAFLAHDLASGIQDRLDHTLAFALLVGGRSEGELHCIPVKYTNAISNSNYISII